MRSIGRLAWPLLICYFLALAVFAKDTRDSDNIPIRVSIRNDALQGAASCQHTFGQIELLNSHHSEHISIYSIQTSPEDTVLIQSMAGESGYNTSSWGSIPQQLHVSRLPSGSLSLGPGQVAIVPLTFLPRYPEHSDDNWNLAGGTTRFPPLSTTAQMDLVDLLGAENIASLEQKKRILSLSSIPSKRRNNLEPSALPIADEFEVNTKIVVETSKGILLTPISASSLRKNPYSIPDVIRFRHPKQPDVVDPKETTSPSPTSPNKYSGSDGAILIESVRFQNTEPPQRGQRIKLRRSSPSRDCYDIYVTNPAMDRDLEISEVLISRPDLMSVEFDPNRLLLPPDLVVFAKEPSQVVREWTEAGPMYLPADSVDNYVATVCTAPNGVSKDETAGVYLEEMNNWIDAGDPKITLGFLQIRTAMETLFIALERFPEVEPETWNEQSTEDAGSNALQLQSIPSISSSSTSLLKASVEQLNFRLVSSSSPPSVVTIDLQNKSPAPIRIMRVSIGIKTRNDPVYMQTMNFLGLEMTVRRADEEATEDVSTSSLPSLLLPASSTVSDAFVLSCRCTGPSNVLSIHEESFQIAGTIVIRGTMDTELGYDEWQKEMAEDPFRDMAVTLEIPYTVTILNGRVEVTLERSTHPYPQIFAAQSWDTYGRAVATLFFPLDPFDATEDSEAPLPTQRYRNSREIGHDLRVMSNIALPLKFDRATITDENGSTVFSDSVCARFNVTRTRAFEPSTTYPDFEDLGFLALQYKFSGQKERLSESNQKAHVLPTTCYLNIMASPQDTGTHRIPLIVFPAQLAVSSPSHVDLDESTESASQGQSAVSTGQGKLLTWLRSSVVGRTLFEVFGEATGGRKSSQFDSEMLTNYLRRLCQSTSDREKQYVKPILLSMGAIEHSEIAQAPLYFTNHNPIPITLKINVGEVEGMSISLGRDEGHTRGEGASLLDFLPKNFQDFHQADHDLVGDGSFRGHPVDGLRQFLMANADSLGFAERFPLRDAIALSKSAIGKHPYLTDLYKWHSYAEFHRKTHEVESASNTTASCDESVSPPFYSLSSDGQQPQQSFPGPFLVSGDKKLARSLQICSADNGALSDGSKILIPPGGTARLDVKVRSPPRSFLETDISQLLATGLVLSTNLGRAMPIFATFEALQGQLNVWEGYNETGQATESHVALNNNSNAQKIIEVPVGLAWESAGNEPVHLHRKVARDSRGASSSDNVLQNGVDIHLSSSFSREVNLLNVESCSSLFHVMLRADDNGVKLASEMATNVGSLRSVASCPSGSSTSNAYPSFYQCALNWLSQRQKLPLPGCGSTVISKRGDDHRISEISQRGTRSVIHALEKASIHLETSTKAKYQNSIPNSTAIQKAFTFQPSGTAAIKSSTKRRSDGFVDIVSLGAYAKASEAWKQAEETGLTTISSHLRATLEYDAASEGMIEQGAKNQQLSLSMHNVLVQASLKEPKLYIEKDHERNVLQPGVETLNFPPARVGDIVSMMIPLQNPTSVPVTVRLSAASQEDGVEADRIRHHFLRGMKQPYIQSAVRTKSHSDTAEGLWWDGGGAFWFSDNSGDIIRSNYNVTIKAGPGAHVGLINPSLHSISGFVLGCGLRCGLRDDTKLQESPDDPRQTSVIGAAAAAGITLCGRKREAIAQKNEKSSGEPYLSSGGTPIPGSSVPSAFAIPFSSLDEIVLPPYGSGELGPIFFRPPGRYDAVGCDLVKKSGANHLSTEMSELCATQGFQSLVFLENSLTGVERLILSGTSQWEQLYFIDPPPREDEDSFGNIELRNGHDTLMFPGSGVPSTDRSGRRKFLPSIRQVVLYNGGDTRVKVSSVYLSGADKQSSKSAVSHDTPMKKCKVGTFQLLDCWESKKLVHNVDGNDIWNNFAGFTLGPGESRHFFLEHSADCTRRAEFLSLNVDIAREGEAEASSHRRGKLGTTPSVTLMTGYQMNKAQFSHCSRVTSWGTDYIVSEIVYTQQTNLTSTRQRALVRARPSEAGIIAEKALPLLSFLILCSASLGLLWYSLQMRSRTLQFMLSKRLPSNQKDMRGISERKRPSQRNLWNAAFRCLARADPNSTELQALGLEQVRHVIVGRYRARGVTPPQSLSTKGTFTRDRTGVGGSSSGRQRGAKESGTTSERVRTLSDALFRELKVETAGNGLGLLPAGLGWRVAYARGIIDETSIQNLSLGDPSPSKTVQPSKPIPVPGKVKEFNIILEGPRRDGVGNATNSKVDRRSAEDDVDLIEEKGEGIQDVHNIDSKADASSSNGSAHSSVRNKASNSPKAEQNKHGGHKKQNSPAAAAQEQNKALQVESKSAKGGKEAAPKADDSGKKSKGKDTVIEGAASSHRATSTSLKAADNTSSTRKNNSGKKVKATAKVSVGNSATENEIPASQKKSPSSASDKQQIDSKQSKKKGRGGSSRAKGKIERKDQNQTPSSDTTTARPGVAPPPGLAPPPGFVQEDPLVSHHSMEQQQSPLLSTNDSTSLGDMLTAAMESDLRTAPQQSEALVFGQQPNESRGELFFTRGLAEAPAGAPINNETGDLPFGFPSSSNLSAMPANANQNVDGEANEELSPAHGDPSLERLLNDRDNNRNGFDVMDFLDSILDDGAPLQQDDANQVQGRSSILGSSDIPLASSNPWATEHKSRASAYGISFDDDAEDVSGEAMQPSNDDAGGLSTIPLLTPAAILMSGQEEEVSEDDRALSFYASLIDE